MRVVCKGIKILYCDLSTKNVNTCITSCNYYTSVVNILSGIGSCVASLELTFTALCDFLRHGLTAMRWIL